MILLDGVFHADPHPGNILVTPDGRLALLDFGSVGRLSAKRREQVLVVLGSLVDADVVQAAQDAVRRMPREQHDHRQHEGLADDALLQGEHARVGEHVAAGVERDRSGLARFR